MGHGIHSEHPLLSIHSIQSGAMAETGEIGENPEGHLELHIE
jgi:hypothetical protein